MGLDVFDNFTRDTLADAARNIAPNLPAQGDETFGVAWREITEWHNANAYQVARANAYDAWRSDIEARTGERLPTLDAAGGELQMLGVGGTTLDDVNSAVAKIKEKYPGFDYVTPLTENDLNAMTLRRMAKAKNDARSMSERERTWGGVAGSVFGSLAAATTDPVTLATLPLGGAGEVGIALRALEFAAIGGGTVAANAAINYRSHEAAVPGSSKEIPGEIASAALFGAALGGAFGALGKWLGASSKTLPTAARDDVNAAASDAQLATSNVFDGTAAEVANRDAVTDAVRSIVKGEPVKAGEAFDGVHVAEFAAASGAKDADAVAATAEQRLRPLTHDVVPDPEPYGAMPADTDAIFNFFDDKLAKATPEERVALGATDAGELAARPAFAARSVAPDRLDELMKSNDAFQALQQDMDRIRAERATGGLPDLDISITAIGSDGTPQLVTRKLEDVLDEIDGWQRAAKALEGCATGMEAAE